MEKRMKKLQVLQKEMPKPPVFSTGKSSLGLLSWGSTRGAVLESQKNLLKEGIKTESLSLSFLQPFPKSSVREFLQSHRKVLLVEQNITGQLGDLVCEKTGWEIEDRLLKYDGRPIFPEEITRRVKKMYEP